MEDAAENNTKQVSESPLKPTIASRLGRVYVVPYLIWKFTQSNFMTFIIPISTFGILGALVPAFTPAGLRGQPSTIEILQRFPAIVAFNWYNTLVFDLGNQRSAESIQEDILNKPWRPIPAGEVTSDQARRALLFLIPVALWLNYQLGVWEHGLLVPIISYLYNDLRGSDEIIRDPIIAVVYGVGHSASLKIAVGNDISREAFLWVAMIGGVTLTTMQVQDLKDQAGDRSRGRRTVVLLMGEWFSRTSIAFFVVFWSFVCTKFWALGLSALALPGAAGTVVIARVLLKRTPQEDAKTWIWWCFWTMTLFSLPVIAATGGWGGR